MNDFMCKIVCLSNYLWLLGPSPWAFLITGRAFSDKVDRLKLAEIVKQAIEEKTNLEESH